MSVDSYLHLYKNVYYNLPQSVKTFFGTLYGNIPLSVRFGESYKIHKIAIAKYEKGDKQYQQDYLYNKTYETLAFAESEIPYYKKRFLEYGVSAKDFKSFDDLKKFPQLTKEDIITSLDDLYTDKFERPAAYYTGGSTSTPTKYFLPLNTSRGKEKAYSNYIFSKVGYRYRDKSVLLKGREVADFEKNIFWEKEPVDNYLIVSGNYLNSEYFSLIYAEVKKNKLKYFVGYPSVILDFVRACKKNNFPPIHPLGVILTSEMVMENELNILIDFFECDILTHYGLSERLVIGYRINQDRYNFLNNYGLSRVVDNEIIAVGFDNFVMPFINYKTNDYIGGEIEYLDNSDIATSVDYIDGRLQEHLVAKDGNLISLTVMASGHFSALKSIAAMQYAQKKIGIVELFIQTDGIKIDTRKLKEQMEDYVKNSIDFQIVYVDFIEKSSRGKRVMCKQSLNIDGFR